MGLSISRRTLNGHLVIPAEGMTEWCRGPRCALLAGREAVVEALRFGSKTEPEVTVEGLADLAQPFRRQLAEPLAQALARDGPDLFA